MKAFGQVVTEARKKAGLTQKEVAERLRRADGRKVLPPYLNDLEHDRGLRGQTTVAPKNGLAQVWQRASQIEANWPYRVQPGDRKKPR